MDWNCPVGCNYDPCAPWNQEENTPVEVEVEVTVVTMKKIKIQVTDYAEIYHGKDRNGNPDYEQDFSGCDFWSTIREVDLTKEPVGNDYEIDDYRLETSLPGRRKW